MWVEVEDECVGVKVSTSDWVCVCGGGGGG
jgi:hypothetical protein